MATKLKIGRNDPCPCGSLYKDGSYKKYKKCCLQQSSPFSPEFAHKMNEQFLHATAKEHEEFVEAHARNTCYLCGLLYDQYDLARPCSHWLLRPSNIKKGLVASILTEQGCFRPQAFLRWLANTESFGTQINDWSDESDQNKIFETTIKYKNFEWSFTCSSGDLAGHKDSVFGTDPHFHFQMRINGVSFIDYGDYHPAFTPRDVWFLNVKQNKVPGILYKETFGAGMNQIVNEMVDTDLHGMIVAEDETSAQFHMGTILKAAPGTLISGDEVADIMEESKRTGVPMAILLRRLKNVSVETLVEPGPAVAEKALRTPRKRGRTEVSASNERDFG